MTQPIATQILASPEEVARTACELILMQAQTAIANKGLFHLVLAGGSTPTLCYHLLASAEADWPRWHIYFGDERCLPPTNPERNSQMAEEALLSRVNIPKNQIHPIPAELGAKNAAAHYSQTIAPALPFDLVLLGMGEDGHTASLFPGHIHENAPLAVPVHDAPKSPPDRVSLNYSTLENCRQLLILVAGEGKQTAIQQWQRGDTATLPIARITPKNRALLLLDRAAAPH